MYGAGRHTHTHTDKESYMGEDELGDGWLLVAARAEGWNIEAFFFLFFIFYFIFYFRKLRLFAIVTGISRLGAFNHLMKQTR